jgi:thiamine biosynthesis lipoprotein
MQSHIPHIYNPLAEPLGGGLLYAWFPTMHTRADIVLYSRRSEALLAQTVDRIAAELDRLQRIGNCFDPDSELSRANRNAALAPVTLSPTLYDMLARCLAYHETTCGYFDITLSSTPHTPDTIRSVVLLPDNHTIFFCRPEITLNLSGFLKGYALEAIRPLLQADGIHDALVSIGNSSVLAMGNHPAGQGWKVGFSFCDKHVVLHDECLTTSGNDTETRRHIVNPKTGELVEGVGQVAVVTQNGAVGEMLSTALFAMNELPTSL